MSELNAPRFKNLKELLARHTQIYDDVAKGDIDVKKASETNNAMGKILNGVKIRLEIAHIAKSSSDIIKKIEEF